MSMKATKNPVDLRISHRASIGNNFLFYFILNFVLTSERFRGKKP